MRNLFIAFVIVTSGITCLGQSSFKGLTPGQSTRAEVEKVLGRPLKQISETLAEYKSKSGTEQIFVQYLNGSGEVARIEATYVNAIERSSVLGSVNLPPRSTRWQINAKSRLEEYFSGACVVLTYFGADVSTGVSRIGYYSPRLFESSSAKLAPASSAKSPPGLDRPPAAANNARNTQPPPSTQTYLALVTRANGALQASNFQDAVRFSEQAVKLDPKQPAAYEIAGIAQLYGLQDVSAATLAMRAAVERGGTAAFSVSHDHDGFFKTYCQGSLYITKVGVNYRSNDGAHAFLATHTDLKDIGRNSFVGANLFSFHIKVMQNGKSKNFNFAPGRLNAAERDLILEFLKTQ